VKVAPAAKDVAIPASGERSVAVSLMLGKAEAPLDMPRWWRLFPDADPGKLHGKNWASMPETLPKAGGGLVVGQQVMAGDHSFDFAKRFGSYREKRPVVGFAYMDSPTAVVLPVAASADWWMAWYVNGRRVYSTLKTGNRHGSLADHLFELPLRAGRNVVAFQCLSGSRGWSIRWAGPRERALAVSGGVPPDRLRVTLVNEEGQKLAERMLPLELQAAVPPLGRLARPTQPKAWRSLEPLVVLGEADVTNRFADEPDVSRWYQGEHDLSAVVWLRDDGKQLRMLVAVRDDVHDRASDAKAADEADALRIVISDRDGRVLVDQTLPAAAPAAKAVRAMSIDRAKWSDLGPVTAYLVAISADALGESTFRLSLRIFDSDNHTMKQTLDLGDVELPSRGRLIHREQQAAQK
jgi:hypothetical protein